MTKVKVRLVQLGSPPVSLKKMQGWKSEFFEIVGIHEVLELPDPDGSDGLTYSNTFLDGLIDEGEAADIKMGVIYAPIEDNFYMHRLSDHCCVLSLHEMAEILTAVNIPLETFVVRNLYEIVAIYHEFGRKVNSSIYKVPHKDTRGCLYDFNAFKANAIWSTERVNLCASCKSRLKGRQLPSGFIQKLEDELSRIKKPLAYKVLDFIKAHPVKSFLLSSVWALVIGLGSNLIYGYFNKPITSLNQRQMPPASSNPPQLAAPTASGPAPVAPGRP